MRLRRQKPKAHILVVRLNKSRDRKVSKAVGASIQNAVGVLRHNGLLNGDVRCEVDARYDFPPGRIDFMVQEVER